jgi:hypothetical protein
MIKQYEQRLTEAENRLKEFKLKNLDLNATEGRDFFANMAMGLHLIEAARRHRGRCDLYHAALAGIASGMEGSVVEPILDLGESLPVRVGLLVQPFQHPAAVRKPLPEAHGERRRSGLHGRPDHGTDHVGHLLEVGEDRVAPGEVPGDVGDLGDVHRHVADPLEVEVDVHDRRDQSEVRGDRRLPGQQIEDAPLHVQTTDLKKHLIDGSFDDFRDNVNAVIVGSKLASVATIAQPEILAVTKH